jgi:hypothetical protein
MPKPFVLRHSTCHFADCYGQPEKLANFQIQSITHSADFWAMSSEGGLPEAVGKPNFCKHARRAAAQ